MPTSSLITGVAAFLIAIPLFAQQKFDSAESAAKALIDAAESHNTVQLAAIFGPRGNAILTSGNPQQDRAEQSEFARLALARHKLLPDHRTPSRVILSIGDDDWPFPVPIIRTSGRWSFDPSETRVEMQARRIGTHELDAIEICAGYVTAQRKYASERHGKDQVTDYAARFNDTPGRNDGLYGSTNSLIPRGLAEAAYDEKKGSAKPYHGYYFRILDNQGPDAPGGVHSYRIKDRLMGGFALVAWPAQYGVTGIQTFIVNQDGVIYEKDIAPPPGGKPLPITCYDPDRSWTPVE